MLKYSIIPVLLLLVATAFATPQSDITLNPMMESQQLEAVGGCTWNMDGWCDDDECSYYIPHMVYFKQDHVEGRYQVSWGWCWFDYDLECDNY